jgi:hypothetical protein
MQTQQQIPPPAAQAFGMTDFSADLRIARFHLFTSAQSVLLIPNSLMKPSASSTPQSSYCA